MSNINFNDPSQWNSAVMDKIDQLIDQSQDKPDTIPHDQVNYSRDKENNLVYSELSLIDRLEDNIFKIGYIEYYSGQRIKGRESVLDLMRIYHDGMALQSNLTVEFEDAKALRAKMKDDLKNTGLLCSEDADYKKICQHIAKVKKAIRKIIRILSYIELYKNPNYTGVSIKCYEKSMPIDKDVIVSDRVVKFGKNYGDLYNFELRIGNIESIVSIGDYHYYIEQCDYAERGSRKIQRLDREKVRESRIFQNVTTKINSGGSSKIGRISEVWRYVISIPNYGKGFLYCDVYNMIHVEYIGKGGIYKNWYIGKMVIGDNGNIDVKMQKINDPDIFAIIPKIENILRNKILGGTGQIALYRQDIIRKNECNKNHVIPENEISRTKRKRIKYKINQSENAYLIELVQQQKWDKIVSLVEGKSVEQLREIRRPIIMINKK